MQPEHLVLRGGLRSAELEGAQTHRLDITGPGQNIDLRISDISRTLVANIPDVLTDLLELATYVYCADGTVRRGGGTMARKWAKTGAGDSDLLFPFACPKSGLQYNFKTPHRDAELSVGRFL